ncbi:MULTISPECIES: (d)CMP kinase [Acinetobacter calcoaceticus/baumannii complex]|uniref:Cytidylate kinase n=1 Tax=Acinetobacter lactucae TaxID=1785128 RepID=A0A1V0KBT4_9GAMM|nr:MULTISPECIES: (d)CMP kinase [Acinetobacter calcoaceticus/baumannii complex]ARD29121.1 cytidylate kinase [Acinetobacter lactucae]ETR95041.1 cytidylate kinase [Acinetobacter lactucae]KQE88551.1 cytidylate kinase [Acinetobacter lactucae]MCG9511749.1 (d)CMP kinase [Acinetobacter pittii]MDD9316915.1 (d)CMP kinase [Acinetobacter lactucae]
MTVQIITIDGPSGSGKGTLAAKLAAHYQYHLLDSGALYRLLGLSLHKHDLLEKLDSQLDECIQYARQLDIKFETSASGILVFLDGEDVSQTIRTERVGEYASKVAVIPELRQALFERQRAFAQDPGLVADGRDMATSIFPEANAKIYLTASAESRAERRVKQLQGMGLDAKINDILANIQARDKRDMEREVAPLKPAKDAYIIDSSELTIDQVFKLMVDYVDSRTI